VERNGAESWVRGGAGACLRDGGQPEQQQWLASLRCGTDVVDHREGVAHVLAAVWGETFGHASVRLGV